MIFHIILFNLFILSFAIANAMNKLWLIRHCDKDKDKDKDKDYCCSKVGLIRSHNWINYFNKYISSDTNIKIYTSKFYLDKHTKICETQNAKYYQNNSNQKCQKSQRMITTSKILYDTFINNSYTQITIKQKYCIGDEEQMYNNIIYDSKYLSNSISEGILVWEHSGIIDILHKFGFKIDKWSNKNKFVYNIIFIIDLEQKKLYYDCYDYINDVSNCDVNIRRWLKNYNNINYHNDYKYIHNNNILYVILIVLFIMLIIIYIVVFNQCKN